MVKRLCITIGDWVWETYLRDVETTNMSRFVEGLIVKGFEADTGDLNQTKQKLIVLQQTLRNKEYEIKHLKKQIGKYKHMLGNRTPEQIIKEMEYDAIRLSGINTQMEIERDR